MFDDYKRFVASGGDIRKAKIFNNCKGEPLFYLVFLAILTAYAVVSTIPALDSNCKLDYT